MARRRMTKKERTRQIVFRCMIVAIILIAGFTGLYIALSGIGKTEVSLNECTHLSMSGFNGEGIIEADIDVLPGYDAFFDTVHVEFSKHTELTNGDEISITYTYDKKLAKKCKLKVSAKDQVFVVKGLVEPVKVSAEDLFKGVDVTFEGIAPMVTASLAVDNTFDELVSYEITSDKDYYDVGDEVSVTVSYDDAVMRQHNYLAEIDETECTKCFKVEDVDRYLTSVDEIDDDMMASLKKEAISLFTEERANEYGMRIFCDAGLVPVYINKKTTFVWNSPSYISSYLNVLKPEAYGKEGKYGNDIKLCFESAISQSNGVACNAEVVVRYTNVVVKKDNTIDLNVESGEIISADRRDSHIKAIVQNKLDDDYEATKID